MVNYDGNFQLLAPMQNGLVDTWSTQIDIIRSYTTSNFPLLAPMQNGFHMKSIGSTRVEVRSKYEKGVGGAPKKG